MKKNRKPGPDSFQNNGLTLEYLDHDPSRDQIVSVDPFVFKDRDTLFRYLDQKVRREAAGIIFQALSSGQACSGLLSCMDHLSLWLAQKPASMVFAVSVRLDVPGKPVDKNQLTAWKENGLRLIHWQCAPDVTQIPDNLLWQVSSQRIWNHLSVPGFSGDTKARPVVKCIMDNPHIVHSFDIPDNEVPVAGAYDKVAPLPGRPAWKLLGTLDRLLACMIRVPMEQMIRLRYRGNRLILLGRDIEYRFTPPTDLPQGYLDMVCAMVAAGGSVDPAHVRSNLEKAYLIGYAEENGVMVGNSCLKHPRKALIDRLKTATDLDFNGFVERGYTSVRPEYRALGVGRKLLKGLTTRAGKYKVFSLIGEDNMATQKIAQRNNTKKIATYFSEKANKQMGIWMPEQMIFTLENNADDAVKPKDNSS